MKKAFLIILSFAFLASFGINLYLYKENSTIQRKLEEKPQTKHFKFTNPYGNPTIESNIQSPELILHYHKLGPGILAEIGKVNPAGQIGLYLQDVKTGGWYGVNETQGFIPASLLKVPLMMATLKKVERQEIKLTDKIELISEDLDTNAGDLYKKGAGYKLDVWELLKMMIQTSDNTAKNAIKRQLLPAEINAVFAHVGIPNPYMDPVQGQSQFVTPRGYTRVLKGLYLSSFLAPDLSEKALDLMTDTQVESLISAGVPAEIQIAHKYGERPDELTDCGIIYHPQNPYYLCIMVKNLEITQAKTLISSLSKIIYEFISSQ